MPMEEGAAKPATVEDSSNVQVQEVSLLLLWRSLLSTVPTETTSMMSASWMATTWKSESHPLGEMALAAALDALATSTPNAPDPFR